MKTCPACKKTYADTCKLCVKCGLELDDSSSVEKNDPLKITPSGIIWAILSGLMIMFSMSLLFRADSYGHRKLVALKFAISFVLYTICTLVLLLCKGSLLVRLRSCFDFAKHFLRRLQRKSLENPIVRTIYLPAGLLAWLIGSALASIFFNTCFYEKGAELRNIVYFLDAFLFSLMSGVFLGGIFFVATYYLVSVFKKRKPLPTIRCLIVLPLLFLFFVSIFFAVSAQNEIYQQRLIVDGMRSQINKIPPDKKQNDIFRRGRCLVWNLNTDYPQRAYNYLPGYLKASSSDNPITVFMVSTSSAVIGHYVSNSGDRQLDGRRQTAQVYVAYWPENKIIGFYMIEGTAPDSTIKVNGDGDTDGEVDQPIADWIIALPSDDISKKGEDL